MRRPRRRGPGQCQAGFTLLEVLVAVSIFAVLAALSYAALSQYLQVREKLAESYRRVEKLQRGFLLLERDLRYITNRAVRDEYGDTEAAFVQHKAAGLAGELLRFTTAEPSLSHTHLAVLRRVAWRLQDGNLYREVWPALDQSAGLKTASVLVMDAVSDITVDAYTWSDQRGLEILGQHNASGALPYAIELVVTLDDARSIRRLFALANGA